jgi:hypothetical protein
MISLEDAWIKSAVEHRTIEIKYFSGRTKAEMTVREVEPDYFGWSRDGKNFGCWGICRLRGGDRCFKPDSVYEWRYVGDSFEPNPYGRWQELLPIYKQRGLAQITLKRSYQK